MSHVKGTTDSLRAFVQSKGGSAEGERAVGTVKRALTRFAMRS